MRLFLAYAVIGAVLCAAFLWRLDVMQDEINSYHERFDNRIAEQECVHRIFEDGSAVHVDAEVAHECLQRRLGWP